MATRCKLPAIPFPELPSISLSLALPGIPLPELPSFSLRIPGIAFELPSLSLSLSIPGLPLPELPSFSLRIPGIAFELPSISLSLSLPGIPFPELPTCPLDLVLPMSGFGTQPLGNTSAGVGHAAGIPLPGQAYESGPTVVPTRKIDPVDRNYIYDTSELGVPFEGMDPIDEMVLLRLTTPKRQLAMNGLFGNDFLNAKKDDGDLLRLANSEARIALRDLIETDLVRILSIAVEREGSAVFKVVTYENMSKKTQQSARAAL